jgi:hypothetical protein
MGGVTNTVPPPSGFSAVHGGYGAEANLLRENGKEIDNLRLHAYGGWRRGFLLPGLMRQVRCNALVIGLAGAPSTR